MTRDEAIAIGNKFRGRADFIEAQIDLFIALGILRVNEHSQQMDPRAIDAYEFAIKSQEAMEKVK